AHSDKEEPSILPLLKVGFNRRFVENSNVGACLNELVQMEHGEVLSRHKLRMCNAMFSALDCVTDSVEISNQDHEIQYVNSAYERLTGYMMDEVVGKDSRDLRSDRNKPDVHDSISGQLKKGKKWEGTYYTRRKSGDAFPQHCKICPVVGPGGKPSHYVSVRSLHLDTSNYYDKLLKDPDYLSQIANGSIHGVPRRKESFARIHSMTIEAPITKVINIINTAQESSPLTVVQALDKVLEILRTSELYSPYFAQEMKGGDPMTSDYLGGLVSQDAVRSLKEGDQPHRASDQPHQAPCTFVILPLVYLALRTMARFDVCGFLNVSETCLANWLQVIEASYHPTNTYHNSTHAADVLNSTAFFLQRDKIKSDMTLLSLVPSSGQSGMTTFSLVPSAVRHDTLVIGTIFRPVRHDNLFIGTICRSVRHDTLVIGTIFRPVRHDNLITGTICRPVRHDNLITGTICRPQLFDPVDEVASLIAAAVHDLDHPGKSNAFLINSHSELSVLYNDIAVLENHHAALTFKLTARDQSVNIFKNLDRETFRVLRQNIIDMVLATEMMKHFEHLNKFVNSVVKLTQKAEETSSLSGTGSPDSAAILNQVSTAENKTLIKRMLIKCADVSNPCRPKHLCVEWARRIAEEYFEQTDEEKRLGLPVVMPVFDRKTCSLPKSQTSFIDFFIKDMFDNWDYFCDIPDLKGYLESNYDFWVSEEESPTQDYDMSTPRPPQSTQDTNRSSDKLTTDSKKTSSGDNT
ncbi:PDE8B-like protein, partial [Mya arenaria]